MKKQVTNLFQVILLIFLGVFFIAFGVVPLALAIANILPDVANEDFIYFVILVVIMGPIGIWLLIYGSIDLYRYNVTMRVKKNGKRGICTITDYKEVRTKYGSNYYMIVSYNGESNKEFLSKVKCHFGVVKMNTKGTKIECLMYLDDCFVDVYNIKQVKNDLDY